MFIRCIVLAILAAPALASAQAQDPFNNTVWAVRITPDESTRGVKPFDDDLHFKSLKFWSKLQKEQGFEPADYEPDTRARGILPTFTAETRHGGVTAKWSGKLIAGRIEGELVLESEDADPRRFAFTGERKRD